MKADELIVTNVGITIDDRLEQPLNALAPILVTEFGIVTEARFEQDTKA